MPRDIFTEPVGFDLDTLANLAGTWEGQGLDTRLLQVAGRAEAFHHVDKNLPRMVAPPKVNSAATPDA